MPATFFDLPPTPTSLSLIRADFPQIDSDPPVDTKHEAIEPMARAPEPDLAECDRFSIVSPYAAGGQGQVFVARDQQLNRDVALKELKPKHADRAISRARFLREAEIAGGLEHPGVVPVYALGKHLDGRPFYAMRLIKGRTMHQWIRDYHRPQTPISQVERNVKFRQLLQRFISVCETIAYAHSRGILHRDIKPSNVLIGDFGEAIVVDWGLARRFNELTANTVEDECPSYSNPDSDSRADSTMMGSALGTPAFMSPEQAEGRWDHVGPPSDVYSLGATLYVLLTGQLPLKNLAWAEMSRRIRAGEIPTPRQVTPWVSRGLDAICRKAMAINPANRYATAKELAEDVERWLADEPVLAGPEPLREKVRRWVRHHRIFVTTMGAILVVTSLALGVGLYLVDQERNQTELARQDTQTALEKVQDEQKRTEQARQQTQTALEIAKKERKTALEANEELTSHVIDQWLTEQDELLPEHRAFLKQALVRLQAFVNEKPDDPMGHLSVVRAYRRVGEIQQRLGNTKDALPALQEAETRIQSVKLAANDDSLIKERANINTAFGNWYRESGQIAEATTRFAAARSGWEKISLNYPDDNEIKRLVVNSWNNHAVALADQKNLDQAAATFEMVLARRREQASALPAGITDQRELIRALNNLGNCQAKRPGQLANAEAIFREAAQIAERRVQINGRESEDLALWAAALSKLGSVLVKGSQLLEFKKEKEAAARVLSEAEQKLQAAIAATEQLVSRFPSKAEHLQDLALLRFNLAEVFSQRHQWPDVIDQCEIALTIAYKVTRTASPTPRWQANLKMIHDRRSIARSWIAMNLLKAEKRTEALQMAEQLAADQNSSGETLYNVACVFCQAQMVDRSMDIIKLCAQTGFFCNAPKRLEYMENDSDLAQLRAHPEFAQFRESLKVPKTASPKK